MRGRPLHQPPLWSMLGLAFPSPPRGSTARGPRSLEARVYPHRTGESARTHTGNREHLTGLSVLLCGCAESSRRVSGQPLSVSLAPSGGHPASLQRAVTGWSPRTQGAACGRGPPRASCTEVGEAPGAPRGAGSGASPPAPRRVSVSSPGAPAGPRSRSPTASAGG